MNQKTIDTLEFNKILEGVKHYAMSDKTKQRLTPDIFSTELVQIEEMIGEVDEAVTMLRLKSVELGGISDIMGAIKRAEIGSPLSVQELNQIRHMLYRKKALGDTFKSFMEDELEFVHLPPMIEGLEDTHFLHRRIRETVDDEKVLDHASELLLSIRRKIVSEENRMKERLNSITRSSKMLSDAIITTRNDRYVVPVKVEYRSEFKGIVHDMSASGQTVYMEPLQIVQMSNNISQYRDEEAAEVERILFEISNEVALVADDLKAHDIVLHNIDMIFSKAKYGVSIKASKPEVVEKGGIHLPGSFHPLIPADEVVKNDIFIDEETSAVIITGPNTGGKTVTLKTVGLSVLMAQSGIPIPCRDGAQLKLFNAVYSDIGDEQSIEQSLSTFSSHMTNITRIIEEADEHSLVLLDELGAGTDPEEGASLAISIIEFLLSKQTRIMATTHYPHLKTFSYSRDDVINASVEFDVETLSPTYRLMMGVPGKSNAFEISNKLGLNPIVVDRARNLIGHDSSDIDMMIDALERHTKQARENDFESESLLKDNLKLNYELNQMIEGFNAHKETLQKQAREEINRMVRENEAKASEIIQELEQMRTLGVENIKSHDLIDKKKQISDRYQGAEIKKKKKREKDEIIKKGDLVDVLSYSQKGEVLSVNEKDKEAVVQMGIIKMKLPLDELKKRKREVQKSVVRKTLQSQPAKRSVDLRGERYEEALIQLDRYLDQATLQNYQTVEIIHGKGTGALQAGVQKFLRTHKKVKSFRGGMPSEGGFGVTIVEMK